MARKIFLAICCISFVTNGLLAQLNNYYTSEITEFEYGLELFQKRKYSTAQKQFQKTASLFKDKQSEYVAECEYYAALCALELFNKDAETLFITFLEKHPHSPKVKIAYFQLGKYNYRKKNWDKVIEWFDKVDVFSLNVSDWAEFYFKKGYSFFELSNFTEASKAFYEIKDVDTEYTAPGLYYYSHIAYNNKEYETALTGFKRLQNDEKFGPVVPYYITQILYMGGKYDELIEYAPALLDSANPKRAPEIARLLGESYYRTGKFGEAIPYLERYQNETRTGLPKDIFQIAFACYKAGQYQKAVDYFIGIATAGDTLSQISCYHMAECYVKLKQPRQAINSYYEAYKIEIDVDLRENALFNYARLSFENAFDPYFKAADAIWKYIEKYPDSKRRDEALGYLTTIYLNARNYKAAMVSLDAVKEYNEPLKKAYQLVAYNLGVDNLKEGYYSPAIYNFEKSRKFPYDRAVNSLTYFWIADAQFHLKQFEKSTENFKAFIFMPEAILQPEFKTAYYNLGYCYFKTKNYAEANNWFRKFALDTISGDPIKIQDCYLRIADCYFVSNDYSRCLEFYDKNIALNGVDADYALYQKAIALGLLNRNNEKVQTLEILIAKYDDSGFIADAKYHLAQAYIVKQEPDKALPLLEAILKDYPNHPTYNRKAMMDVAQIHYNAGRNPEALYMYKTVMTTYPKMYEAGIAFEQTRKIYTRLNQIDSLETVAKNVSYKLTDGVIDSATYDAPYLKYVDGDCNEAAVGFKKYLDRFPDGIFAVSANYYMGECFYASKNYTAALESFSFVISQPASKFTEPAIVKASRIAFNQALYKEALMYYIAMEKQAEQPSNKLEGVVGQMRCFYKLRNYDAAIDYANKVLISEKISDRVVEEAHLIAAKCALELGDIETAYQEYKTVSEISQNVNSAESRYGLAFIHYLKQEFKQADSTIFVLVDKNSFYDYWVAKGLILLSDVYMAQNDLFQAKHTLTSIVENYEGADLKDLAKEKLNEIQRLEGKKDAPVEETPIEINFIESENPDEQKLFEEEPIKTNETPESDL